FSLAGLYIAGRSARARSVRMLFVVYLALNLIAFLLSSPIGSNANRLFAIAGAPLLWLAANLNRQRSRLLVFPILRATPALQAWLRSLGVRYVLLPDTKLDYSSVAEAKLLRSGQSGLVVVGRTSHWTFYELPRATPIVTGPVGVGAQLVLLQSDRVWVDVSQP